MEQGARSFTKFVNTIASGDLFTCLALWMEDCPLANTSFAGFNGHDHTRVTPFINEDSSGPVQKKLKATNDGEEVSSRERMGDVSTCHNNGSSWAEIGSESEDKRTKPYFKEVLNCANGQETVKKPMEEPRPIINKIGVVMVDSSGKIVTVECSRDYVHGVTSVLVDFCDRANNCVMYTSRKPCSFCTKLMIQAGVAKVCYLPFEPECSDPADLEQAEKLFRMSQIGQSIYIPNIQKGILADSEVKRSPYTTNKFNHVSSTFNLLSRYWSEQWKSKIAQQLRWPEFNDCKQQVEQSVQIMLEWIARVTFGDLPDSVLFQPCDEEITNHPNTNSEHFQVNVGEDEDVSMIPDPNSSSWQRLARHMSRMANILAQRSNDPKRGVGAIILQRNRVVSASWNGYPPGAAYGDFPRASHSDGPSRAKKYPFSIHAEQAAILGRNTRDVRDVSSTLFVSKTPCDECIPLILKTGIKNVVFPRDTLKREPAFLEYVLIKRSVADGKLKGFHSRVSSCSSSSSSSSSSPKQSRPSSESAQRHLVFNGLVPASKQMKNEDHLGSKYPS